MPRTSSQRVALLIMLTTVPRVWAGERIDPEIASRYEGTHQAAFTQQFDRVRLLTRQAQLEASARLGLLRYREGFRYPLRIRFEDSVPPGLESALAYVRFGSSGAGFAQELVVNMTSMENSPFEFDQVFRHEMTHAVLNDAVGGEATLKIPHWVQEGFAQYVSEEGDSRVAEAASHVKRSQAGSLRCPLNGPVSGYCYPQYYLAIKYLYDKHSSNAVQMLARDLIAGQPINDALLDTLNVSPERFESDVAEYSLRVFQDKAQPDY